MDPRKKKIIAATSFIAAIGIGTGVAIAAGGDDNEAPITGSALSQAKEAALDHVGEGRVTDTEIGDEESFYEVEVTKDNGDEVDVQLDRNFKVVGSETDGADETEDDDEAEDAAK